MEIGSVADWIGIIVSVLGFGFLALTYESQLRVQKDQQELTRIEQANFRLQFLPYLTGKHSQSIITILVSNNSLITMMTFLKPSNRFDYVNLWHHYGDHNAWQELMAGMDFIIHKRDKTNAKPQFSGIHDEIFLFFLDSQNNLYEQSISFETSFGIVVLKAPKYIKNVMDEEDFKLTVTGIAKARNLDRGNYF